MNEKPPLDLATHVPIVGWLLVVTNAIFLLVAAFVFMLLWGIGFAIDEEVATRVMTLTAIFVGGLLAAIGTPGIVAGWGVLARRPWGRVLAIVIAILSLFSFPFGTLVGAYALWVLLPPAAAEYFSAKPAGS